MKRVSKKILLFALSLLMVIVGFSSLAHAKWQSGIGTGIMRLNVEGDMGFHVNTLGIPATFEVDLDPDDISDLAETAFGFGGFASDGKWMVQYSFSNMQLEGNSSFVLPGGALAASSLGFEITGGELVVGYPLYQSSSVNFRVHTGFRYTAHDIEATVTSGATQLYKNIDEDWVDGLVGVMLDIPITNKVSWNTRLDAGYGGSEGTYLGHTGIGWRFHDQWSTSLYGKYTAVEYENSNKGAADWYLYDIDEFGAGLNFMFIW